MEGGNPISSNAQEDVKIQPETKPQFGPVTLNIKVSHGPNDQEVSVPSNSTFGDLKSIIVQKFGLNPETHKLLFRGKEKEDGEDLLTSGVKNNSKVLLMGDSIMKQNDPEEVKTESETKVISIGGEAVAKVREEVDKLADKVSALQVVVDGGTKVDDKDILYMIEMLMRQLLKLDGIEAEGEGKMQRRKEVRRVQSLVETMDLIKSRNLNPFVNGGAPITTAQWETFEPVSGSVSAPLPISTPVSSNAPTSTPLPPHPPTLTPLPSQAPNLTPLSNVNSPSPSPYHSPSSTPTPLPYHVPTPTPLPYHVSSPTPLPYHVSSPTPLPYHVSSPTPLPYHVSSPTPLPYHVSSPTPLPYHVPTPTPLPYHVPTPTPLPYHVSSPTPLPYHVSSPTPLPYHVPTPTPLSYHVPTPTPLPYHTPTTATYPSPTPTRASSPASSPMPSSTKVTQDWEPFD